MHTPSCPPQVLLTPVYIVLAPGVCFCRWWIGWSTGSYFSHRVSRWSRDSRKGSLSFGSFPNDRFLPSEAPDLLLLVNHHDERYFCDVTWQDTGNQHKIVVYVCWKAWRCCVWIVEQVRFHQDDPDIYWHKMTLIHGFCKVSLSWW